MVDIPSIDDIRAEKARRKLREYVRQAWPSLEPAAPFVPGWHIDAICEHLQAVTEGQIRKLIINIPPGHCKSLLVSVCWPTWEWTRSPATRLIGASYSDVLSTRDSVRARRLMSGEWYQGAFGHVFSLTGDQNAKQRYENDKTGLRVATSIRGMGTGERGDRIVADDPHNVTEGESEAMRQGVLDWWDGSMSTRDRDPKTCARVIIMQRVHEMDLSGHLLKNDGSYEHLCLPAEYEPGRKSVTVLGNYERRTEAGELLHPDRFGAKDIEEMKRPLARFVNGVAGQLQQRPAPAEGGLVKRHWWRYWQPANMDLGPVGPFKVVGRDGDVWINPVTLPDEFEHQIDSWDATFNDAKNSDYVVGGTWARAGSGVYLLDRTRGRMDFTRLLTAIRDMRWKWPRTRATLIEKAANGDAAINVLRHEIMGVLGVEVRGRGPKDARLQSCLPLIESGNVFLPHPALLNWVSEYVDWMAVFPNGEFDDDVDMTSQALNHLQGGVWQESGRGHREALIEGKPPQGQGEITARPVHKWIQDQIRKRQLAGKRRGSGTPQI